jgi:non-ribosomal peptide synthetase component F
VWELFVTLAGGGTLHLIDPDTAVDGQAFAAYMQQHGVDALKSCRRTRARC